MIDWVPPPAKKTAGVTVMGLAGVTVMGLAGVTVMGPAG